MRKLALSTIVAFAFYMGAAVAQSNMGGSAGAQGTQGASPNSGVQTGQPAPTETPSATSGTAADQNGTSNMGDQNKGEKKLKGCVESQGSQYMLETKKGAVALTGQDVSAHVGHEVTVKGTWENSANAGSPTANSSASSSGSSAAWSKGTFNVTDVKMDSKTCKIKGNEGGASSSGTSSAPGEPTTGTTTPGSGGSSNSTTTPPPQQ